MSRKIDGYNLLKSIRGIRDVAAKCNKYLDDNPDLCKSETAKSWIDAISRDSDKLLGTLERDLCSDLEVINNDPE